MNTSKLILNGDEYNFAAGTPGVGTNKYIDKYYLNGTEYKIKFESGGWQPGANTIAYYPLNSTSQGNDMKGSGTAYNLSASGTVSYATVGGVSVMEGTNGYLSGTVTTIPVSNSSRTISIWTYLTSAPTNIDIIIWAYGTAARHQNQQFSYHIYGGTYPYLSNHYDDCFDDTKNSSTNTWYNFIYTYDGTTQRIYRNGVEIVTNNITLETSGTLFKLGGTGGVATITFQGYLSECIIETGAWDADTVSSYFNQTKSLYGIS